MGIVGLTHHQGEPKSCQKCQTFNFKDVSTFDVKSNKNNNSPEYYFEVINKTIKNTDNNNNKNNHCSFTYKVGDVKKSLCFQPLHLYSSWNSVKLHIFCNSCRTDQLKLHNFPNYELVSRADDPYLILI